MAADLKAIQDAIIRDFTEAVAKIPKPKTGYASAQHYAARVGKALDTAFRKHIGDDVLIDGFLTKDAAKLLVREPLTRGWDIVSAATADVQTALNEAAKVNIRGVTTKVNKRRVDGMVGVMSEDKFEKTSRLLPSCTDNIMRAAVDTTAWRNASINSEVGLEMTVERIPDATACDWCQERAGVYPYEAVKEFGSDVWQRHRDCGCVITTSVRRSRR